jgi:uncharacterized protein YjbJ (UPF0337 family)
MNRDVLEGKWKRFKGSVREQWGKLTADHFDIIAGKREALRGRIQEACGITKGNAARQVIAFEQRGRDYRPPTMA